MSTEWLDPEEFLRTNHEAIQTDLAMRLAPNNQTLRAWLGLFIKELGYRRLEKQQTFFGNLGTTKERDAGYVAALNELATDLTSWLQTGEKK